MQEPTIRFVIPSVVSSHFHIRDGDIVADFGAGVGNFIPELSKRAGPDGRVYACEIQKNLIETLGNIAQAEVDYKRAIEINPDYTFAIDALKALDLRNKKFHK